MKRTENRRVSYVTKFRHKTKDITMTRTVIDSTEIKDGQQAPTCGTTGVQVELVFEPFNRIHLHGIQVGLINWDEWYEVPDSEE